MGLPSGRVYASSSQKVPIWRMLEQISKPPNRHTPGMQITCGIIVKYHRCFPVLTSHTLEAWNRLSYIFMCVLQFNMYISQDHPDMLNIIRYIVWHIFWLIQANIILLYVGKHLACICLTTCCVYELQEYTHYIWLIQADILVHIVQNVQVNGSIKFA